MAYEKKNIKGDRRGRPGIKDRKHYKFALTEDDLERVRALANEAGVTIAEWVRQAMLERVVRIEKRKQKSFPSKQDASQ